MRLFGGPNLRVGSLTVQARRSIPVSQRGDGRKESPSFTGEDVKLFFSFPFAGVLGDCPFDGRTKWPCHLFSSPMGGEGGCQDICLHFPERCCNIVPKWLIGTSPVQYFRKPLIVLRLSHPFLSPFFAIAPVAQPG
uniref:Uncharacterized protein n=1 Tax=Leptospirillum ferrodiazotrophum TaxID=412449 RepID=C6I0A7_9BACT|nr:MAG: hypothetical protein UBAL3_95660015 [Leptospirillum ferrodiazotrophum]